MSITIHIGINNKYNNYRRFVNISLIHLDGTPLDRYNLTSFVSISASHCRRLLESGQIKGKKLGHDWVVLSLDYKRKRKLKRRAEH